MLLSVLVIAYTHQQTAVVKHSCMSSCACLQVARLAEEEAEQAAAVAAAAAAASPLKQVCFDAEPPTQLL